MLQADESNTFEENDYDKEEEEEEEEELTSSEISNPEPPNLVYRNSARLMAAAISENFLNNNIDQIQVNQAKLDRSEEEREEGGGGGGG